MILCLTPAVFRKSEFNLYPFYSKKRGGGGSVALTRKPSFGNMRPFLHQYEVKGYARTVSCGPNSAPSSPVKSKESGFKRSLSFGAGARKKPVLHPPSPRPPLVGPSLHVAGAKEHGVVTTCATPTSQVGPSTSKCVLARQCELRHLLHPEDSDLSPLLLCSPSSLSSPLSPSSPLSCLLSISSSALSSPLSHLLLSSLSRLLSLLCSESGELPSRNAGI